MATKSVLKSSVSAVLAAIVGAGLLLPVAAQAQERPDRGERGAGRSERSMPAPPPPPMRSAPPPMSRPMESRPMERPAPPSASAPSWQNRGPMGNSQPSWGGRPAVVTQGGQPDRGQPDRGRPTWQGDRGGNGTVNTPPAWSGRPAWQQGDRGSNAAPSNGRPAWQQGGQNGGQAGAATPTWGGRNPTYADPARNPTYRPQPGRDQSNVDHTNDHSASWSKDRDGKWYRDSGWQWRQDRAGQWYRDHADNWGRNNNGQWYRNGNGANTGRGNDWNRGNNGWGNNGYNNGYGNNGYNNGYGNNGYGRHDWDRDGWRRDNRYNWYGWRNNHHDIFRGGYYDAPYRDYSYSRLSIGFFLGNAFFDQRYWIADPYAYRLPPAYEPYQWVRYYDDVLLVDTYSGEVVDVIYDFFD